MKTLIIALTNELSFTQINYKLQSKVQTQDSRGTGVTGYFVVGVGGGDSLYGVTHAQEYHNAFTLHHSCFENS